MNRWLLPLVTGLLALVIVAEDASASRASRDAEYECEEAMERRHDAERFHGLTVSHRGNDYKVTGYAERDGDNAWFECWVDNGRVEDLEFNGWPTRYDDDDDDDKAKKVAAGVAAIAVIAAIASAKKSHDNDHDYDHNDYRDHDNRSSTWSPARGVTCYRNTRQCYESGHGYSAYWTNREFH